MSNVLLAVDPGVRGCGCALFVDNVLQAAAYVVNLASEGGGPREAAVMARELHNWNTWTYGRADTSLLLVLEWPQHYSGRAARGGGDDLLSLAAVDGAIAALFYLNGVTAKLRDPNFQFSVEVQHVTPHDWKGSIPKPKRQSEPYIVRERVVDRLSEAECAVVEWPKNKKLGWDVADAIGIGLHALGRFERKRGGAA